MTKQDEARDAFEAVRMALMEASEALELAAEAAFAACNEAAEPERDTQERINADAGKFMKEYWGCFGVNCDSCSAAIEGEIPAVRYGVAYCSVAQRLDLLRRQRELCEREAVE